MRDSAPKSVESDAFTLEDLPFDAREDAACAAANRADGARHDDIPF
jgi:hypothetical protein